MYIDVVKPQPNILRYQLLLPDYAKMLPIIFILIRLLASYVAIIPILLFRLLVLGIYIDIQRKMDLQLMHIYVFWCNHCVNV